MAQESRVSGRAVDVYPIDFIHNYTTDRKSDSSQQVTDDHLHLLVVPASYLHFVRQVRFFIAVLDFIGTKRIKTLSICYTLSSTGSCWKGWGDICSSAAACKHYFQPKYSRKLKPTGLFWQMQPNGKLWPRVCLFLKSTLTSNKQNLWCGIVHRQQESTIFSSDNVAVVFTKLMHTHGLD